MVACFIASRATLEICKLSIIRTRRQSIIGDDNFVKRECSLSLAQYIHHCQDENGCDNHDAESEGLINVQSKRIGYDYSLWCCAKDHFISSSGMPKYKSSHHSTKIQPSPSASIVCRSHTYGYVSWPVKKRQQF
ncbi:hypothetical protein KP509_1Z136700 [Ceratopteris richardii]|nr:hypothetical protein KP509_1Z136700 [Ceratopteris richardii]